MNPMNLKGTKKRLLLTVLAFICVLLVLINIRSQAKNTTYCDVQTLLLNPVLRELPEDIRESSNKRCKRKYEDLCVTYNTNYTYKNIKQRACHSYEELRYLHKNEFRGRYFLASYPGSGNTWGRLLLEELTGIYTGSTYCDDKLFYSGMFGEGVQDESIIAIKTHKPLKFINPDQGDFVVFLVRNPYHAILSRLSYIKTNSHEKAPSFYQNSSFNIGSSFKRWTEFMEQMVLMTSKYPEQTCVIQFDKLVEDLEAELRKLVKFINYSVSEASISCVVQKDGEMKGYRRATTKGPVPYTAKQLDQIKKGISEFAPQFEKLGLSYNTWAW